jgi:hypothetical protein
VDVRHSFKIVLGIITVSALVTAPAWAKSPYDQPIPKVSPATGKIIQYSLPKVRTERVGFEDLSGAYDQYRTSPGPRRISIGSAAVRPDAVSPGAVVDNSYMDDQYRPGGGRMVDWRKKPYIHFGYSDMTSPLGNSRYGYNVYNPINGTWPKGATLGCVLQSTETGSWVTLDVNSKGLAVLAGDDNVGGPVDNHFYYQSGVFACGFGAGSVIDSAQYNDGFLTKTNLLHHPRVEIQEWAGDTITHIVATESGNTLYSAPEIAFSKNTVNYFRKVGASAGGTWTGPVVIDTCRFNAVPTISASRVSPKVAISYCAYSPTGELYQQRNDVDIWYRTSDSVGLSWNPPVNLTQYPRNTASYSAFTETKCLYDLQGFLHIVWYARPIPKDVYDTANYFWDDLQSSLFHWTNRTGLISKVHNAEWGTDANQEVCGFGSPTSSYVGYVDLSECNGRIYITFSQYLNYFGNDATPTTPANIDDCASSFTQRLYAANGEIFMCVSNNLDGTLWDAARNLTKSYTPDCDSAGWGGVCMNDTRATMSRYGMDITSFDTNSIPVTLIWPGTELVDPTPAPGSYTGNQFLHLFYTEDHWPAPGWRSQTTYGKITLNPLRWVRLACAAPVPAAQIVYSPTSVGYPGWVKHGAADTLQVTITNEGNTTLNISNIGFVKQTATGANWLGTSVSSLSVPAGSPNTDSVGVYVNLGGAINAPGTIVALSGYVYMKSNAKPPRDSVVFAITNYLVADTLVGLKWDTVTTGCTRLIVSNNGDIGRLGQRTVNMDYVALGGECVTDANASVYAYDGGPIVIRKSGSNYIYSNALFQGTFTTEQAFKPFAQGAGASSIAGSGYDGYYTGTFVNRDTTVGVRRTYYAPTGGSDTCNFIIQKSVFFGLGGTKTNVTLGEAIDWDIPSMTGSNNDGRVMPSKNIVYQQGVDDTTTRCQKHYNRFGSIAFLGMYTPAEKTADTCANDVNMYGAYTMLNDTLFKYDSLTNSSEGAYFWNQMGALLGLTAAPFQAKDLHMVMTYKHNIPSLDSLTTFTAIVSVKNGDTTALKTGVDKAAKWYMDHLRPGCGSCCLANSSDGRTGNIDADPEKGIDISDVSALIAFLYIPPYAPLVCEESANCDGEVGSGIDIADISALISRLYIPPYSTLGLCH